MPPIGAVAGPGVVSVPVDASGGGGFGLGFIEVGTRGPTGPGGVLARPLPVQAASAVGGLLPAGPAIRGDSGAADAVPHVDEVADPLLLAAEQAVSEGPGGDAGPDGPAAVAEAEVGYGDGPIVLGAAPDGSATMALGGGLPMLVAGLRVALGRPATPPTPGDAPPPPEDLPLVAAAPLPGPAGATGGGLEAASPRDDAGAAPTRPRVLRTALIGAAALAVGLILPDLAVDRTGLRHRRPVSLRPWRFPRPRTA